MINWIKNLFHKHIAIDSWKEKDGFSHGDAKCFCGKRIKYSHSFWGCWEEVKENK